jgi:hypothetical protein
VIFIDMPRLLREILREAVLDAGMHVQAELDDAQQVLAVLESQPPGTDEGLALVASDRQLEAAMIGELLARAPRARMLAVSDDAAQAALYELRPHRTAIGDASPAALVAALHGAVG